MAIIIKTALLTSLSIILLANSTIPMMKPIDVLAEASDSLDAAQVYISDDNSDNNDDGDAALKALADEGAPESSGGPVLIVVGEVAASPAMPALAQLQTGDTIRSVNGTPVSTWNQVREGIIESGESVTFQAKGRQSGKVASATFTVTGLGEGQERERVNSAGVVPVAAALV